MNKTMKFFLLLLIVFFSFFMVTGCIFNPFESGSTVPSEFLKATVVNNGTAVYLEWLPLKWAQSYSVYRSTSETGSFSLVTVKTSLIASSQSNIAVAKAYDAGVKVGRTYYYKIQGHSGTSDGGLIGLVSADTFDSYEPDDSFDTATELKVGIPQIHSIGGSDASDYFTFAVVSGTTYTITTSSAGNGNDVDTYIYLYAPDQSVVSEDDDGGSGAYSQIIYTATNSGIYSIRVRGFSSSSQGEYVITLSDI